MGRLTDRALSSISGAFAERKAAFEAALETFLTLKQVTIIESNRLDELQRAGAPAEEVAQACDSLDDAFAAAIGAAILAGEFAGEYFPLTLPVLQRKAKLRAAQQELAGEIRVLESARLIHQGLTGRSAVNAPRCGRSKHDH